MADWSEFSKNFKSIGEEGRGGPAAPTLPCREFSEFKEALEGARKVDDGIIYRLNTSIPTLSFKGEVSATDKCRDLYEEVKALHTARRQAIQQCVEITDRQIQSLRDQRNQSADDPNLIKSLRNEQTKLRLMKNELTVEEIARDRTIKVFKERCWQAYKPTDL